MRKMCLLSFLLLLLTLPFLVHGSASAQTETLRVMVYDRENMPEEYGSCEDNAWVRYIQSRVLRELDISPRRWKRLTSWPRRKGSSAYEPSCARLRISMRNGIAAWPPISPRAAAAPLKPSVPPIAKALQKRKEIDHVENIFHLQGQEQVHCTGKRNYHTRAGSAAGGRRVRNAKHNSK